MSKLDRIIFRLQHYKLTRNTVDWTKTTSDHAAVIATLKHEVKAKARNEHIKLDNDIIKNHEYFTEINNYLIEQLSTAQHMNPHSKLDFAKMTIRTKTIEIMQRNKKKLVSELHELNEEIIKNNDLLTRYTDPQSQQILLHDLEELKSKKEIILQKQGEKLAHFAKARWYNDGEKSNKYFLNLLKRRASTNEMTRLSLNGRIIEDDSQIRETVTNFYGRLYNNTETINIDNNLFDHMFKVENTQNTALSLPVTKEELWANLKNARATTPGPDGLSNTYLKKLWHVQGDLLANAWTYSIQINELPPSHKQSLLRLIPKSGKDLSDLKNWRPITLSNCDHKLITKTYNQRLLNTISTYITPIQTAYVKGRNISDNL